jgi:iron complex outermembrane receptor protein
MISRSTVAYTLAAAISATLAASAVQAAESVASGALEDVVVTAQKRSSSLQDVPFSVAATTDEQIRNAGAGSIVDLARNVAGLSIADLGPGQSQIAIRGISSGQVIRDQPGVKEQVGVYLDESPISVALFTPDLELFDLQRFEVLRGPQGTLFGSGSSSGTLRYITQQPKLNVFEGVADMSVEVPTGGSVGGSVRAAVNLPVSDRAAIRFAGYGHHLPGFIDALQPGGQTAKDVNDGDRSGFRVALLWKPTDALTITPRIVYQNLQTNGFPREDVFNILANPYTTTQPTVTIGQGQQYTQLREGILDDFLLSDVKAEYDFGRTTLTSITSYTNRKVTVTRDGTSLTGSVIYDIFGDTPEIRANSPLIDRTRMNVASQELRLSSNGNHALDWLVGGFFQHVGRSYGQSLPTPGFDALAGTPSSDFNGAPPDNPFWSSLGYSLKQYAAFGEATYHVNPALSVTGGLRLYKFDEDRMLNFGGLFTGPASPLTHDVAGHVDSKGASPRLILSYKASEDAQFNAQVSRGFRLGGINDPINKGIPGCSSSPFGNLDTWEDEKTTNFELGAKLRFLDRKVTLNVSAFYADIKNLQATVTVAECSSRLIVNVPKASSTGFEAELVARPNLNWDFALSATYVDAKLKSSVYNAAGSAVYGGLADGNQLPTAPKFQGVGSIGYTLPLSSGKDFFSVATLQYVGSSYSQFENEQSGFGGIGTGLPNSARLIGYGDPVIPSGGITFDTRLGSYTLGNIRAGVRTDKWEAALYVNNVSNENAHLAIDYERGRSARVAFLTNQPRTVGVSALFRF